MLVERKQRSGAMRVCRSDMALHVASGIIRCHHGAGESTIGGSGRWWNLAGWTPAQLQSLSLFRRTVMQLRSSLSQLWRLLHPRSRYQTQQMQQSQRRHRQSGRGLKIALSPKAQRRRQHDV